MTEANVIKRMHQLLISQDTCVLATSHEDRPLASLMAYLAEEDGRRVYFLTDRRTAKHANLKANPKASLVIDTRAEVGRGQGLKFLALTVSGSFEPVAEVDQPGLKARLLKRHPELSALAARPESEVVAMRVESFTLLDGPDKIHRADF